MFKNSFAKTIRSIVVKFFLRNVLAATVAAIVVVVDFKETFLKGLSGQYSCIFGEYFLKDHQSFYRIILQRLSEKFKIIS